MVLTPVYLKKVLNNNRSFVNGALFSGFSFINKGFSFLLLLLLANYITPLEYGYLNLYTTVMMLLGYFMVFSTDGFFSISFFREGVDGCKQVYTNMFALSLLNLLIMLVILFSFGGFLSNIADIPLKCLFLAVATVFFGVYTNINLEYFRINENVAIYGFFSCGFAALDLFVTIILVKDFCLGWEGRTYSLVGCNALYGIFSVLFFINKGYLVRIDKTVLKTMLWWGIPLIPHLATTFLKQGCDRYIINYYHTTTDVGIFSFALNITTIITMVGFGFNQSNSVNIYKICGDESLPNKTKIEILRKQRKKFLILYSISSLAIVLLSMLLVPLIMPDYVNSLLYIPLLGVFGLLVCFYLVYTNYLFYYKKTKNLMIITFGSSILHLILSLLFTRYSLLYTSAIYCISQLLVVYFTRKIANSALNENL